MWPGARPRRVADLGPGREGADEIAQLGFDVLRDDLVSLGRGVDPVTLVVFGFAADVFQHLLFNLINAEQKQQIYQEFGLDWQWVRASVMEAFGDADRRRMMTQSTNIFRVLIKTLLKAGIITDRTKGVYATWVDMEELSREDDEVVGAEVAEEGITYLRDINRSRKKIGKALKARTAA